MINNFLSNSFLSDDTRNDVHYLRKFSSEIFRMAISTTKKAGSLFYTGLFYFYVIGNPPDLVTKETGLIIK